MTTTLDELRAWVARGKADNARYMLVVCDTYDWENYPVYVMQNTDVVAEYKRYHGPQMQKVVEVYGYDKDTLVYIGDHPVQLVLEGAVP